MVVTDPVADKNELELKDIVDINSMDTIILLVLMILVSYIV
ncbi:hypothetical protein [Clostridium sp.]